MYLETAADGSTNRLDRFTYDNYLCITRNRWSPDGTSATDRFVWDPTEPVATRPLVFYQPNSPPQLYAHDSNKNISELVSYDNGTITAHYEYSSFGEVILSSGDLALANPFRFSSEYSDDALGLVYYNYRHYEPVTGRWMRRDIMIEFDCYCYVRNSVIGNDFLGLFLIVGPILSINDLKDWFDDWYNQENAEKNNWVDRLLACPLKLKRTGNSFGSPDSDEWRFSNPSGIEKFGLQIFHPKGQYELRTANTDKYGGAGNQCVYDSCGNLILEIPSAGTADRISPNADFWGHQKVDVYPFIVARFIDLLSGGSSNEYVEKYYEVRPRK